MADAGVDRLIGRWCEARTQLADLERADHPPLIDKFNREWVWKSGDVYTHCGSAWPRHVIESGGYTLPRRSLRDNPNYRLCPACRGGD